MAGVFIENPIGMAQLLIGPHSDCGRFLHERAGRLRDVQLAGAPRQTGKMAEKIGVGDFKMTERGMEISVGVDPGGRIAGYADYVSRGTRPHIIRPRKPKGMLAFKVAGRTVFARHVNHPGTRPNPYLTRFMDEIFKL